MFSVWRSQITVQFFIFFIINSFDYHVLFVVVCAISAACLVYIILDHVMQFNAFFDCLANECCLFEKAEELNTSLYEAYLINRSELRSRYAKYILKQEEERLHRRAFARD